ncbi:hypothetical protein RFI_08706 [Reticulomyxa filosa]|uniref:Uncharacterized protein n=1 Tax=Reticulomyxa filosa TaxID=46433 RepID=X6NSZ9_RETFI|nr:hypothetical protein RFI_08706 [Reticulomyxa filosa]|eukprot:ETO28427.1 hypothetical protein RFI_08706 [Reticulomyxa filosa]
MADLKESLLEKQMNGMEDENETQSFLGVASADRAGTNSLNNLVESSSRKESDMNRSSQLEKSDITYDPDIHTQSYMTITEEVKAHRVHREVMLVTTSIFMSYSSLVVLQKKLYDKVEANHANDSLTSYQKQLFEHGTSLVPLFRTSGRGEGKKNFDQIKTHYYKQRVLCEYIYIILVGNLLFRLLHNMLLGFLTPRNRVVLSLLCGYVVNKKKKGAEEKKEIKQEHNLANTKFLFVVNRTTSMFLLCFFISGWK